MTKEEMAKAYAEGFEDKKYGEIAYTAFLCGFTAKCESSLPSDIDEAAEKTSQSAYSEPTADGFAKRSFFKRGFKAGAEWLAGQFFPRWRNINEDKPKQGEGCACIIVTVNGRIKYSNFEDGPWFWSEKIDDELLGETEAFIGHNFYGDKEYHTCSHWMPWDEFMGALERMLKK